VADVQAVADSAGLPSPRCSSALESSKIRAELAMWAMPRQCFALPNSVWHTFSGTSRTMRSDGW
jgi:hypothetical protein